MIYVYRHLDVKSHEGWLKVGETKAKNITGDGRNRRIFDQNSAANIPYEVLYETDAVTNGGKVFSDHDIHAVLEALDIEREQTINPETKRQAEWFKTDLETVIEVIEDYKKEADRPGAEILEHFTLREEQNEAVRLTRNYYEAVIDGGQLADGTDGGSLEPAFLWNAKPRFGKTLTAYSFAAEIRAQNVLIVTNRPAIADSWWSDFYKFGFSENGQEDGRHRWMFTCSEAVKSRLEESARGKGKILSGVYTRTEQLRLMTEHRAENSEAAAYKNLVHFISLQDIKGQKNDETMNAFKEKNQWIFDLHWDLLIIDESHEGADTRKAMRVFDNVDHDFTLHLSGTPFKALASNRFSAKQIFNWSYTDEQLAKQEWNLADGHNPYANLPQMNIYTYQLSRALELSADEARGEDGEYAFDLGEFFKVGRVNGEVQFIYEDKVRTFVKNLSNPDFQYPFSSEAGRENLRHTFWLLPGVNACLVMKKILLEDEYFGAHYKSEDIIVAAGNGDEDKITKTALDEVRRRIGTAGGAKHPLETRTITLSCGQLTTGVTVPEWSAVLMLNNCKSPALYMQAAFRAQNPYEVATSGGECYTKENCYVFDFAPDRVLQTLAEMADSTTHGGKSSTREEKVRMLINFLPVLGEDDEGRMKYLDANEVLTIPLKLITEEVVSRGFMSNRLFENISNLFGCPKEITEILDKLDEAKGPDVERDARKKSTISNKPRVWEGKDKKIHVNEDIVINTSNGLLGEKKYVEIDSDEGREVQEILQEVKTQARAAGHDAATTNAEIKAVERCLPKLVATLPVPEPQLGEEGYFEKEGLDEKPTKSEPTEEQKTRDRLRGFARTIPSFLMAYGSSATKLENFGDNIPEEVFLELTNISKDEFRMIRDGFEAPKVDEDGREVLDADGQPVMEHKPGFINADVFNSSVAEFVAKRKTLGCYWVSDATEDIFEYIPPQKNNQIFTPRKVVREMIDLLEQKSPGIFASTTNTFIDLYMKSGMYITEIVRRIFAQTRAQYPTDTACIQHILEQQVYGFAPSAILQAITQNYIFGFDESKLINRSHFVLLDTAPLARDGTLPGKIFELFNGGKMMKFTAVVGNQPYHINDGGGDGASATPVYQVFVEQAKELLPDFICFVTPSRWMKGGKGLDAFRNTMLNDTRLSNIVDYELSETVFSGVKIDGGVSYFLWNATHTGELDYKFTRKDGSIDISHRFLKSKSYSKVVRDSKQLAVIEKALSNNPERFEKIVSARKPYGFCADLFNNPGKYPKAELSKEPGDDRCKVYGLLGGKGGKRTTGYVNRQSIRDDYRSLDKYKLFFSKAFSTDATVPPETITGKPDELCTETFLQIGPFPSSEEAAFCLKYIKTKFFRALLYYNRHSLNISRSSFELIPIQNFTRESDIDWSKSIPEIDQQLYKKYGLGQHEIDFIEQNIKEMA